LWQLAEDTDITIFGISAAFITGNAKAGIEPGEDYDLRHLKSIASTGSSLPPDSLNWMYNYIKKRFMGCFN